MGAFKTKLSDILLYYGFNHFPTDTFGFVVARVIAAVWGADDALGFGKARARLSIRIAFGTHRGVVPATYCA